MKKSENKSIEELIERVMKHSSMEATSADFTSLVMGKVEALKTSPYTTYDPLISKRGWFVMFSIFIGFVAYAIWLGQPESSGWFDAVDYSFLSSNKFSKIFNVIQLSKTSRVSILMFALMLLIQIPLLKHYFDKRVLG